MNNIENEKEYIDVMKDGNMEGSEGLIRIFRQIRCYFLKKEDRNFIIREDMIIEVED